MEKLTKKQRLKVYENAKQCLIDHYLTIKSRCCGLCYLITGSACDLNYLEPNYINSKETAYESGTYEEWDLIHEDHNGWGFTEEGYMCRLMALDLCILMASEN